MTAEVTRVRVEETHKLDLENLRKSLESIKESTQALEAQVSRIDGNGKWTMSDFKEKFARTREVVVNGTKKVARKTNRYVTEYPWVAAGVFAGLGILTGIMLKRRFH